jgi:deazaflavin-dependent oxidoreductase (nitroreductase family)
MRKRTLIELMARAITRTHVALYRWTGGRIGGRFRGGRILLLTVTGRKSGLKRTTPLMYVRDGEDLAVVASNGGMDWEPAWWLNLKANPVAEVQVGAALRRVRAEQAEPGERARLWPLVNQMYAGYDKYQRAVSREIAVVKLRSAQ